MPPQGILNMLYLIYRYWESWDLKIVCYHLLEANISIARAWNSQEVPFRLVKSKLSYIMVHENC